MADGTTYFNIVRFVPSDGGAGSDDSADDAGDGGGESSGPGACLLLESPWKLTVGIKPDINRAIVSYTEFDKLGPIGGMGQILFCFNDDSSGDLTLADITLLDAEVIEYGTPQGANTPRAIKYRVIFADKRYQFVEPRGGRLIQGIVNPSTSISIDPSITNQPQPQGLEELISDCLTAMGLDITIPAIEQEAPQDLKWFGTHAPTELAHLLSYADCVFMLQPDGTFEIKTLGDGSDPTIPAERQIPTVTLNGADGRGKTVVFTSFPTQVAAVITENDTSDGDLQFVERNISTGVWQTGVSAGDVGDFWQTQRDAYTHVRLNPSNYNPLISPILNKTWPTPTDGSTSGDLPAQTTIRFWGPNLVYDVDFRVWINSSTGAEVNLKTLPIQRIEDGNVMTFSRQLLLLPLGGQSIDDGLYGLTTPINLDTDVTFNLAIGMSDYNASSGCWLPTYFYCGFSGTSDSFTQMESADAQAAMKQADTIVIAMPDLQAVQFGLGDDVEIYNKSQLEMRCHDLAARYLKGAGTPPRQLAAVGFLDFTFDGRLSEVEIDQQAVMTRFRVDSFYRPTGSYLAGEFERLRKHRESHPHEARTQGSRMAQGYAASATIATPTTPMQPDPPYAASDSPIAVQIVSSFGSGKYRGAMMQGQANGSSGSTFTGSFLTYGVTVFNGPELGSSGAPYLNNNAWVLGKMIGFSASDGYMVLTSACSLGSC